MRRWFKTWNSHPEKLGEERPSAATSSLMIELKDLDSAMAGIRDHALWEGLAEPKQGVKNQNRAFEHVNVRFSRFAGLLAGCDRLVASRYAVLTLLSLDLANSARSCVLEHRP